MAGATLYAQPAGGAEESRILRFSNAPSNQDMMEMATVIRSIGEIRDLNADPERRTITLRGNAEQVALAEWLLARLDGDPEQAPGEYKLADNDVARVFVMRNATAPQQVQEVATAVRSIIELRRLFTYQRPKAIVTRGAPGQLSAMEWLLGQLDQIAPPPSSAQPPEFRMADADSHGEDRMTVFYLREAGSVQSFLEAATLARAITEMRRVFTYNHIHAVAVRGTAEQLAMAKWLFAELDKSARPAAALERSDYRMTGGQPEPMVQLFRLAHASSPQLLQQMAVDVRTAHRIRRVFTWNDPRMIALRGTPEQMEAAARTIAELDR